MPRPKIPSDAIWRSKTVLKLPRSNWTNTFSVLSTIWAEVPPWRLIWRVNRKFFSIPWGHYPVPATSKIFQEHHGYLDTALTGPWYELMYFNPQAPVAQKIAYEVVFRRFLWWRSRVFFKSDLTEPPQIFDAHLLGNTDLSPSRFHFSVGFRSRSFFESDCFIAYSNEWERREK